jgi:hypothetical protein
LGEKIFNVLLEKLKILLTQKKQVREPTVVLTMTCKTLTRCLNPKEN